MNRFLLLLSLVCLALPLKAQVRDSSQAGYVRILADPALDSLMQLSKRINEARQSMPGYRVQLYFGADRKKANDIKASFLQQNNEHPAYVLYHQPNYKVRIGDFRTRLEAYKALQEVISDYPSSFIVKDEIALPPLE